MNVATDRLRGAVFAPILIGLTSGLLALLAGGCGEPPPPIGEELTAMIERAPLARLESDVVIGLAGDPAAILISPTFVGMDEAGHIYVLDWVTAEAWELKRFASDGKYDRRIVLGGEGPYSWLANPFFRWPPGVWVESRDRIVFWNRPLAEIVVFGEDGDMRSRTSLAPIAAAFDVLHPHGVFDGGYIAYFERATTPYRTTRPEVYSGYVRIGHDGVLTDTIWSDVSLSLDVAIIGDGRRTRLPATPMGIPLSLHSAHAIGDDAILEVHASAPTRAAWDSVVLVTRPANAPASTRTLHYRPIPIPHRDLRSGLLDQARSRMPRYMVRQYERHIDIPRYAAPLLLNGVRGYRDGSIWLRLAPDADALFDFPPPDQEPTRSAEYLVLGGRTGVPVRVELGLYDRVNVDATGRIWRVLATPDGEPYLKGQSIRVDPIR